MILGTTKKRVWFTPPGKGCWKSKAEGAEAPEYCPEGAYSETEIVACDDPSEIEAAKAKRAKDKADKAELADKEKGKA